MDDRGNKPADRQPDHAVTRRQLLQSGAVTLPAALALLAAPGSPLAGTAAAIDAPQPPFDSIRDWVAALEAHGLLLRIPEVDQDAFHATGLIYHATDRYTWWGAPAFLFERVRIDGEWFAGPLLANLQSHLSADSVIWGLDTRPGDNFGNFRRAKAHMREIYAANDERWPLIEPVELSRDAAPCKEIVLRGDDIDLTRFPFIKTNPADGGRFVNSGSVFTEDPEAGRNFGTYRCQIKGPRKLMVNSEKNQGGWKMITAARDRGEKSFPVAVVVGQDPVVFMISSTKLAGLPGQPGGPVDELALAGGLRGRALDVVRCETNDMLVPAHAEMVIEGEIPFDEPLEDEGPFGEMYGYLGPQETGKFWMRVTAVTHRRQPWITNMFTGMERGFVTAPFHVMIEARLRKMFPFFSEYYQPHDTMGITYITIRKSAPGQGMQVAKTVARTDPTAKITIVLDDDVDPMNQRETLRAVVARWQPYPATYIVEEGRGLGTDPSQRVRRESSKIAIDATRQWPEEGGPATFAGNNRALLDELAPGAIDDAASVYRAVLDAWKQV